jgi:cleavage and polyadenylation specificity factor subunit 3
MFDCGIHPGYSGLGSLPFLDEVELDQIDVALITHFHLDHCAAVPYLIGKTNFKVGPRLAVCTPSPFSPCHRTPSTACRPPLGSHAPPIPPHPQGRLIMTHPTKAIFYTLLQDFVRVSAGSADEALYTEDDLEAAMARVEVLDFDQTVEIEGIRVRGWWFRGGGL